MHNVDMGPMSTRRPLRRLKLIIIAIVAAVLVAGGGIFVYARYRYDQIPKLQSTAVSNTGFSKPFNILVAGTDSRQGFSASQQKSYGNTTNAGGNRSDATMIVRVNPSTKKLSLLSIPYDTFLPLYGTNGSNKISDALNNGPSALVKTIEQDLHIPINAFVEVNFGGVVKLVQALGGIHVNFPYPSKDKMSGLKQNSGCQLLNGTQALALARSRYFYYYKNGAWQYDGSSGFGRIHRQHTVVRAMINQAKSSVVTNPLALNAFIGTAVKDVSISSNFSLSRFASLALDFRSFSGKNLNAMTLPTQIVNNYGSYGDVLFPVPTLDSQVIAKFLADSGTTPTTGSTTTAPNTPSTTAAPSISAPKPPGGGGSIVTNSSLPSFDPVPC